MTHDWNKNKRRGPADITVSFTRAQPLSSPVFASEGLGGMIIMKYLVWKNEHMYFVRISKLFSNITFIFHNQEF